MGRFGRRTLQRSPGRPGYGRRAAATGGERHHSQAEVATIVTETWITDLTHFLRPQGAIAPPAGPARPGGSPSG